MTLTRRFGIFLALLLASTSVLAQGTTGSLTGTVTTGGNPLPGVTVTVSSPALQGTRTAVSGDAGGYNFPSIPPGLYRVSFELQGMQTVNRNVQVNLAQATRADAELKVSAVAESLTVTATAPSVLETQQVASNFTVDTINALPIDRTIASTTLLAPGVNDAGPNNQITISGAQSFDSLFLVDGAVVNENLRGQPKDLFIEDGIQETTVLTGAISAEYGRFTGGVVSTVTKSGGNDFSGSLRDTLTNDNWTAKTPYAAQVDPIDHLNSSYEGTLGGRILRDRLWFFAAGKSKDISSESATTITAIPFKQVDKQTRWEAKLTGQVTDKHSLVGTYINSHRVLTNGVSSGKIIDLASLADLDQPNTLLSLHYGGVITNNFLIEGQFSRMNFESTQGGNSRDIINGTIIIDDSQRVRGNSATFCGSACPPKQRNNKLYTVKGSYFLSTKAAGDHSIIGGYEQFHQLRNENNFQSGSDFRVHGTINFVGTDFYTTVDNNNGQIEWDPVPALSKGSDFQVGSLFVNDRWNLSPSWSFNVGARYDKDSGRDQAGNKTVDDSNFSPRLGATWDIGGKGRHRLTGTYSRYASKVDQGPADNTAAAGRYASYYWDYAGPVLNGPGTPANQRLTNAQVIRQVFDWFNSVGGTKNTEFLTDTNIPGTTTKFTRSLVAPHMDEETLGYGVALGQRGFVRADLVHRKWSDFYTVTRNRTTGTTTDPNGTVFDTGVIGNSSDNLSRKYDALQSQWSWQLAKAVTFAGNYTYSKLKGNVEGELPSFATTFSDAGNNYPEYTSFSQYAPVGYLNEDMRHRLNAWVDWRLPLSFSDITLSVLERYHSALPYSASATIDVRDSSSTGPGAAGVHNPGYQRPPTSVTYFFSDRGAYRVDNISSTNLALRWGIPIASVRLTFFADLLNALNQKGVEDPDSIRQTVTVRRNGSKFPDGKTAVAFDPYHVTPVEGVNYEKSATFGQPTSKDAYQTPRTYRFAVRVSF